MNMKKLIILVVLAIFAFASTNLFAQSAYTGAAKPSGNSNTSPDKVSGTQNNSHHQKLDAVTICLSCAIPEGEPDIQNNGVDVTDGGCNFSPNLFKNINMGDAFCGRCNGYLVGENQWRDTDWYKFVLTTTSNVYWSCYSNFAAYLIILNGDCNNLFAYAAGLVDPEVPTSISATLGPGTYYLFVAPQGFGPDPANTGDYMVKLSTTAPGDPSTWCNPCVIPTLSEWGLIILALLMVAAGMVYIRKRQYSVAMAGGADVSNERKSLFNRRSYFIILAVLLSIALVVFALEIVFSIAVPVRDIAGSIVSSAILAYILQLLIPFRKE
jgi:hypothetical protein